MIYVKTQNSNAEYDDDESLASLVSNLDIYIYVCMYKYLHVIILLTCSRYERIYMYMCI
jgi:hypothetical protein